MLNWLRRFNIFCFLESHDYAGQRYDWIAGAGALKVVVAEHPGDPELRALLDGPEWVFAHMGFEWNHAAFGLTPRTDDPLGFTPSSFFVPQIVLRAQNDRVTISAGDPDGVWEQLQAADPVSIAAPVMQVHVRPSLTREAYIERIRSLLAHIHRGDCYEINFCQEFGATAPGFDPFAAYARLARLSPTPFGGFYRQGSSFLVCASPERFLRKEGDRVIAQPIKGTARRNLDDAAADTVLREGLRSSEKERAENVMVVDLMRNDLSQVCLPGKVTVPELFGLYTFPQVHQMISTVEGQLDPVAGISGLLAATFPMGSMTGAPKKRVLELIRQYEPAARGLFSGSIGYFHKGDLDLNVVIRSLLYQSDSGYLSYQVGSGITAYCDPEAEWEECRLKAVALERALGNSEY